MNASSTTSFPEAPWFSYQGGRYHGKLPAYFDGFPIRTPEPAEFEALRTAIENYITSPGGGLQPYFLHTHTTRVDSWRMKTFFLWDKRIAEACDAVPEAEKFFRSFPGMVSATVSWLDAGSAIAPHCGDTNTLVRCHLGLRVPAGLPECGIRVNGEERAWEEGRWLLFCDAHEHSVWNKTDQPRYIIIMDLLHPALEKERRSICINGLSLLRMQRLDMRSPFVKKLPGVVRGGIRHLYKLGFSLGLLKPKQ